MALRGARVNIRPWQRQDERILDRWPPYNDPLESLWNLPRQLSVAGESWYGMWEGSSSRRTWAVENLTGDLIGRISLREIDERKGQARLGIMFGAPYVGQGLGSESLALFLDYFFFELGFQRMVLDVAAPNQRAVRCYQRLGFCLAGDDWREAGSLFDPQILNSNLYSELRQFFRSGQHGVWVQFFEMALLRADWSLRRQLWLNGKQSR